MTTTTSVGKDILAFCNKCNLTLSHLVVSLKNEKTPGKVKCNTCQTIHAFKDPKNKTAPKKRGRTKAAEIPIGDVWSKAMKDAKVQPRAYSIKGRFAIGDVITHSVFGQGIVQSVIDNNKIEVLFETYVKHLVHGR